MIPLPVEPTIAFMRLTQEVGAQILSDWRAPGGPVVIEMSVTWTPNPTPLPEPGTLLLVAAGLGAASRRLRRRRGGGKARRGHSAARHFGPRRLREPLAVTDAGPPRRFALETGPPSARVLVLTLIARVLRGFETKHAYGLVLETLTPCGPVSN